MRLILAELLGKHVGGAHVTGPSVLTRRACHLISLLSLVRLFSTTMVACFGVGYRKTSGKSFSSFYVLITQRLSLSPAGSILKWIKKVTPVHIIRNSASSDGERCYLFADSYLT